MMLFRRPLGSFCARTASKWRDRRGCPGCSRNRCMNYESAIARFIVDIGFVQIGNNLSNSFPPNHWFNITSLDRGMSNLGSIIPASVRPAGMCQALLFRAELSGMRVTPSPAAARQPPPGSCRWTPTAWCDKCGCSTPADHRAQWEPVLQAPRGCGFSVFSSRRR